MNENKVHFYITCGLNPVQEITHILWLNKPSYMKSGEWIGNPRCKMIDFNRFITNYGIEYDDFSNMKEGEIKEVFLNLED